MSRRRKKRPAPDLARLAALRDVVREGTENRPGVYRMFAEDGEVLYVGKSKAVRTRLLSYFRSEWPQEKGARLIADAHRVEWEYVPSEFAALLRELSLIKTLRPRHNVMQKRDARHYAFIRLSRGPAPKLQVVRGPGAEPGGTYYGPFLGAQRVGEAVRELSDALGLRDCALDRRMSFSDQRDLFSLGARTPGCIRYEIRRCLGPCIAACTAHDYDHRVALARAFLEGTDDAPMDQLRTDMVGASDRLDFERAASLRDKLQRLEALRMAFSRLRFAVEELTFAYPVPGHAGEDRVYVVRRGRVVAEHAVSLDGAPPEQLATLARSVFDVAGTRGTAIPAHEVDELLLLSSWFRQHPAELARTVRPDGSAAATLALTA